LREQQQLLQNCVMLSSKRIQKYDFFVEIQKIQVKKSKYFEFTMLQIR
jgi:hypothetical protein